MKTNISPRDWELLSEYIDRRLKLEQRQRLEARLKTSPELRAALADLQRTRAMVKSLPRLKAPRSFKLTPAMVGQSSIRPAPARRVYPYFQLASALAMVLLVFVILGDVFILRGQNAASPVAMEPAQALLEEKITAEGSPETMMAAEPTLMAQMEAPAEAYPPPAAEAQRQFATETGTAEADGFAADAAATAEAGGVAGGEESLSAPYAAPETFLVETPTPTLSPTELALALTQEGGSEVILPMVMADEPAEEPARAPIPTIRIVEIVLAIIAMVTAITAIVLRRR